MTTDIRVEEIMVREVAYATIPGSRDEVLQILKTKHISGVPVVKNGEVVGIVTRTDLIKNPEEDQIALLMTREPVAIPPGASIVEASHLMLDRNIRRIPVVEDHTLAGIVTLADIVKAISSLGINDPIEPYLGDGVVTVWEETPLSVVGEIMELADVKAVPVIGFNRKLLGVVTDKDLIAESIIEERVEKSNMSAGSDDDAWTWESLRDTMSLYYSVSWIKFPDTPVREAIKGEMVTATPGSPVSDCAKKMRRNNIDQIPVVSATGKLKGLLRDRDLLRALF
ncbi:MAG TPA: CBS domain-containing protein [Candidatus Methanoperedenaceae archaeon]|nr:CBS domain-containing protein [Candidatus Methanoperedenaceae archaeon]